MSTSLAGSAATGLHWLRTEASDAMADGKAYEMPCNKQICGIEKQHKSCRSFRPLDGFDVSPGAQSCKQAPAHFGHTADSCRV